MRVFEVITEHCEGEEITKTIQFVTSEEDTLKSVTDYYTKHCDEFEKGLIGVREVLTIVEHIELQS